MSVFNPFIMIRFQASIATDEFFYAKFFLGVIAGTIFWLLASIFSAELVKAGVV